MAHRLKSGLRACGRLSAFVDNPAFKDIDGKIATGGTVPTGGQAAQVIPC